MHLAATACWGAIILILLWIAHIMTMAGITSRLAVRGWRIDAICTFASCSGGTDSVQLSTGYSETDGGLDTDHHSC